MSTLAIFDFDNDRIVKPKGKRTPAKTISFCRLRRFIHIFQTEIDVVTPVKKIQVWEKSGFKPEDGIKVLEAIILKFGEGQRVWGKHSKTWIPEDVNNRLRKAYIERMCSAEIVRSHLRGIRGLGGLSYSTKVLRFLNPEHVVLDSILREELCLAETDYAEFANACSRAAECLNTNITPVDVESGLFAWIQILNPNQRKERWKRYRNEIC